jgi:preprotein translocase subunit SecD
MGHLFSGWQDAAEVRVTFTPAGAKALKGLTTANAGKRLAIILDGKVLMAPLIRDGITEGKAHITGAFTSKETESIAKLLNGK